MPPADRLPTYALVSPVRDEAADLPRTIASVVGQTHRPDHWVIVDDGSTDGTLELARRHAREHEWITVLESGSSHERARGAPIVRAFNRGLEALPRRADITVKLDGDLFLPAHYFAWVARVFADVPRAGLVGGAVLIHDGARWRSDVGRQTFVSGVAKAYRTDCLEDIGGLRASMGWDGIDEYAARSRDWTVHVLPELSILHYKRRGSKQVWWRARWEEGRAAHYMGYLPSFLLARVAYRMGVERPLVAAGLTMGAGFLHATLTGAPQVEDAGARALLRSDQRRRLARLVGRGGDEDLEGLPRGGPAFTATEPPS